MRDGSPPNSFYYVENILMATRADFTDKEFGDYLRKAYDCAVDALGGTSAEHSEHPLNHVRSWFVTAAATRGVPSREDPEGVDSDVPEVEDCNKPAGNDAAAHRAHVARQQVEQLAVDALNVRIARLRRENPHNVESQIAALQGAHDATIKPVGPKVEIKGLDRELGRSMGGGFTRLM
jgi:hypothetical protein